MSGGGGELRQARKLTRRPTLLSLHSAAYRKTPGLSIAERKGHPFMHMQEDKFSPQPPCAQSGPARRSEAGALLRPQSGGRFSHLRAERLGLASPF